MPYNGSGTFVRTYNWQNDADASIPITASRMDTEDDGFATGLSTALTKDGQTTPTANLPMGGFKHTNVANATSTNQYATLGQVQSSASKWGGTSTGAANVYAIALTPALTTYSVGLDVIFIAHQANSTTTPTLNIDTVGTKTMVDLDGGALVANSITNGALIRAVYDGTNFRIMGAIQYSDFGTAAFANTGTSGDVLGKLNTANTFSAVQTFSNAQPVVQSTSAQGQLKLFKNATTASADVVTEINMHGLDSASNDQQYAVIEGICDDNTSTSEDGAVRIRTFVAGALTQTFKVGSGVQIGTPTGGDKGVGTINATAIYDDNVQLYTRGTTAMQSITAGGLITVAHGLTSAPAIIITKFNNTTTEAGWAVGDKPLVPLSHTVSGTTYCHGVYADATNIYMRVSGAGIALANKSTGVGVALTAGNWQIFFEFMGV